MSWYKKIINIDLPIKEASAQNIANMALRLLDIGVNPGVVSSAFVNQMIAEDPAFDANQLMGMNDVESLRNFLQTYGGVSKKPVDLPSPEDLVPDAPVPDTLDPEAPEDVDKAISPDKIEEEPDTNEVSEEGIIGNEEILTNQLKDPPNFNDRIAADPTLLESFELPVSQVPTIRNKLAKINKKLRQMYYPEIKIEFVGEAYSKPVQWQNKEVKEPHIQVKISGTMPSPSEEIMIKTQTPVKKKDGTTIMKTTGVEPKGVRLIAKVVHNQLSEEEQQAYLQKLPPDSSLRKVILDARSKGETPFFNVVEPLEGAPSIQGKFWYTSPQYCMACKSKKAGMTARKATYIGAVVPPEQMSNKTAITTDENGEKKEIVLTRRIKNRNTGELEDQPIKIISDEDVQHAAQEQFGGKCIDPFDAVKTITALKNWVKATKKAKENYEKKKSKSKHKGGGWANYPLPTNHLLTVAVSLLRKNPDSREEYIKHLAKWLPMKTRAYTRSLKEQNQEGASSYNNRMKRYLPKIAEEDKQIAFDTAKWWRERLGSLDLETKDKNKISLGVLSTVGTSLTNMRDIMGMVKAYVTQNNIDLQPIPEDQPSEVVSPVIPQETIIEDPVIEEPEEIIEPESPENIVDISIIEEGSHFVSNLKHTKSAEWRSGIGISYYFVDNNKKKYVIFDKYTKDPMTRRHIKTPSMNFNEGQNYQIEGDKGKYNGKYHTTILDNASIFNPETPGEKTPEISDSPVIPETPSGLPSWYGKYDLGKLVEQRLAEGKDPNLVISKFLDSMAMISDKFKNKDFRNNYETTMKKMLTNQNYGGQAVLIKAVKGIYNQFRPKMNWHKKLLKIAAAKNKINSLGIINPSLKFFVHRYEDMIGEEWNSIKSSEDLQSYIVQTLIPSLEEKIDPSSPNNNYLKSQHIDIPQEYHLNPQDPIVQQVYNTYKVNPERAATAFLEHLNYDKKNSFEQWWKYVVESEPYKDNPAFQYSVLKSIIDSSPEDTKAGPPPLNAEALAIIWDEINEQNVTQMNVLKKYRKISSKLDKEGVQKVEASGGNEWIKIPSKISDPDNYQENLSKLQRFSQGTGWCIARQHFSDLYLSKGDFWLYLVDGRPMVAIRLIGDKVQEMRGHNNNQAKLDPYWQEVMSFLHKSNFDYQDNAHYKKLEEIYLMNASLERNSNDYNVVMEKIKEDHTIYLKLSDINRQKFPEFLDIAKQGYANELDNYLVKIEVPGLSENQYMNIFESFQDYYKALPPEIKNILGDMQPRIIDAHRKAFHNNPIILTEFSPEMQEMFSQNDQLLAWKNYVDQDPYHYNDKRIPSEIRSNFSPEFLKEEWNKLLLVNSEHIDHIPPELKNLWEHGELEQYVLKDFEKYPVSRVYGKLNKLERVEKLINEGKIQRPQMIEALTNAIKIHPEWMSILPKNYQDEILANGGDIGQAVQKEQSQHIIRDTGYFRSLSPQEQESVLSQYGSIIGESFARDKDKYYGMLHDFWIDTPPNVRPYMPDEIIGEVAQYYANLLSKDPSNFDNIFSKIPQTYSQLFSLRWQ